MHVAVLGLGEAGSIYAAELAAHGITVSAADPRVAAAPHGVALAGGIAAAAQGADVVLSLVTAEAAEAALAEALPVMDASALFGDMNAAGPEAKRKLALRAAEAGIAFADVAILGPVSRARLETPLILSGSGADELARRLVALDIPAASISPDAGVAAGLKLLRSVFMKGLAATIFEAVDAASTLGAKDWIIDQIASELGPSGPALVQRLLEGTALHAARREAEMREARSFLESLGATHPMTDGAVEWLRLLAQRCPSKIVDNLVSDP
jgi:3-hydroxyisobutyrate dehydrogenase-like beta-hydroxyacid dehydrogenase